MVTLPLIRATIRDSGHSRNDFGVAFEEHMEAEANQSPLPPIEVVYCGGCSLPAEYCEFNPEFDTQCLPWLRKHDASRVDSADKIAVMQSTCDEVRKKHKMKPVERLPSEVNGETNGEGGAPVAVAAVVKKKRTPRVTISRVTRSRRKFLTLVDGLDKYNVDLKEACSAFKKKFACGVTIVKDTKEIEIQGDVSYELPDVICDLFPQINRKYVRFGEDAKKGKK